jgi:uncharacterized protein (DUF1330 family)
MEKVLIEIDMVCKYYHFTVYGQHRWRSPEYRAVSPLREQSAKTNAIVVDGI